MKSLDVECNIFDQTFLRPPAGRDREEDKARERFGKRETEDGEDGEEKWQSQNKGQEKRLRGGGRHGGLAGRQGRECATDVPPPPGQKMC